jgi:azurin
MKQTHQILPSILLAAGLVWLSACGNGDSAPAQTSPAKQQVTATPKTENASPASKETSSADVEPGRIIEITANDKMKFGIESVEVEAGERITIVLKNIGTMPKMSMGHNLVVLKQGTDPIAFATAGSMAARHDYIPQDQTDKIVATTKLLGPGETDEVTFVAPSTPGDYDYICSFPGHVQAGMRGIMKVK